MTDEIFEIFLATPPGLEETLLLEVMEAGFKRPETTGGGVTIWGDWRDVWRANLTLRGTSKVLARVGDFRAFHLAQLDKRSRKYAWGDILTKGQSVKVDVATNKKSKIYHAGAAVERIERAIAEEFGATIAEGLEDADLVIKARIDDNNVILSVDTSGDGLHKRGHKQAMGKAPMRETMAAMFLRACGYDGHEPVLDPMCGSGTFLIEAAEIARNMMAGRARAFSFERLATYDAAAVQSIRDAWQTRPSDQRFYGSDRNVNVIGSAGENAARAGVADMCTFTPTPVSSISRPDGPAGLVIVNPPYGARVGKKKDLFALYGAFGDKMRAEFKGWRVGMITTDTQLAEATKLPWLPTEAPIAHGGLKVKLFRTDPL
ncbi:THUMP domain-containing class I SAM-dependent RNA methyltransferase [Celeribacter marinus]|uniref:Methyltransferase n=1 Tax=Celeribacter marinus TaxID=1397108 RepID=A0A0P0A936_9RHOB|nr:RNA methyltransferase [Celeribacter marinus]ALI54553.1 methyltransferase [Celeribacter marinus]SFK80039.1 putative N6-adenine-specific DNA methylase [Celeribacter marinus]